MFQQQRNKNQRSHPYEYHLRRLAREKMSNTYRGTEYYQSNGTRHVAETGHRSKNHIAKSVFRENNNLNQQKGRRVPLHLLEKVKKELDKLINDKQIIRLEKCPDDVYNSPVVITVKKDKSVKLALDSKKLNKAIRKNKYQMQSIDHLIDAVALYISERRKSPGTYWF